MRAIARILLCLLFVSAALAQDATFSTGTLAADLQEKAPSLNPQYLVFRPANKPDKPMPLLIYLHGAGGVGDDIRKIRGQASTVMQGLDKFSKVPCIVVAPQCLKSGRNDGGWIPDHLNILLQHLKSTLPVDD